MSKRNTFGSGRWVASLALALPLAVASPAARATTKGLSQIVTPDLQDPGQLSLSAQAQARAIGNPWQLQAELGLTERAEVAVFQGLSPGEQVLGTEFALVRGSPFLLSTGFLGWSTRGDSPQPFLEAGWYFEHAKLIGGVQRVGDQDQTLLGFAWDFNPHWRAQVDYQGGVGNSSTFGITWTPSERWQFNPAVYRANDSRHALSGYVVASYTLGLWRP